MLKNTGLGTLLPYILIESNETAQLCSACSCLFQISPYAFCFFQVGKFVPKIIKTRIILFTVTIGSNRSANVTFNLWLDTTKYK